MAGEFSRYSGSSIQMLILLFFTEAAVISIALKVVAALLNYTSPHSRIFCPGSSQAFAYIVSIHTDSPYVWTGITELKLQRPCKDSNEPGSNRNTASSAMLPQNKHGRIKARITVEPQDLFGCYGSFTEFRMIALHSGSRKRYAAGSVVPNDPCGQQPDVAGNKHFSFVCRIYNTKVNEPQMSF